MTLRPRHENGLAIGDEVQQTARLGDKEPLEINMGRLPRARIAALRGATKLLILLMFFRLLKLVASHELQQTAQQIDHNEKPPRSRP